MADGAAAGRASRFDGIVELTIVEPPPRRRRRALLFQIADMLLRVELLAKLLNERELRFEEVDVFFLVGRQFFEEIL